MRPLIVLLCVALAACGKASETLSMPQGADVYTDPDTGCQYFVLYGVYPRIDGNRKHMGCGSGR